MTYVYRCPQCRQEVEYVHTVSTAHVPTFCGPCSCTTEMRRVPQPVGVTLGLPSRTGQQLRKNFVAQNRDGSETVYTTMEQARQVERDRVGDDKKAAYNLRFLTKGGYVPGTPAARFADACDQAPGR